MAAALRAAHPNRAGKFTPQAAGVGWGDPGEGGTAPYDAMGKGFSRVGLPKPSLRSSCVRF